MYNANFNNQTFLEKDFKNPACPKCFSFEGMFLTVLTIAFLGCYAALILFYYQQWKTLKDYHFATSPTVFVSVIVDARNEEKTLPLLVKDLQQQQYQSHLFEVIIVNDFSTDGTAAIAQMLPGNFQMITPNCSPEQSSKKKAISTGVSHATRK